MKYLPNIISLARILMVPVVVWLVVIDELGGAFWVFFAAVISDGLDGFIAKRFDAVTEVGSYLDPVADKALLISIFVALGAAGLVSRWLVILVVLREVLIVGGILFSFALSLRVCMRPSTLSKVNTSAQMALAAAILAVHGMSWALGSAASLGSFLVGALTALSGAQYVRRWSRVAFLEGAKG